MTPRHIWSDHEIERLTALYPDTKTEKIAELLGIDVRRIYFKAKRLHLKKSAAFLSGTEAHRLDGKIGVCTRFMKGFTPWNKGMKGVVVGGKETQFKPGHLNGRAVDLYQPVGSERISKDNYLQRKINDDMPFQRRWRGVHLLVWEAVNGPLPKGHAVVFRDGDKTNTDIGNLELITRAELMSRNTIHNYPKEIAELMQLRGAVTRQINKRERKTP